MQQTFQNPSLDQIRSLLNNIQHIAVVGLSAKPDRSSHQVAKAMQAFGYHIIPVRPSTTEVLGEPAYASLELIKGPVDLVDVFMAPDKITPIIDACIARKIPIIWLQLGIVNEKEALRAQQAGITVIMDRCIYRDYLELMR